MDSKNPDGSVSSHVDRTSPSKPKLGPCSLSFVIVVALFNLAFLTKNSWWKDDRSRVCFMRDGIHIINPSAKLEYSSCFNEFQCARLLVPLDWNASDSHDQQAAIAVIKRPALVDVTDPRYAGPVLLNPGGPGGSGVLFALLLGETIQTIVDTRFDPHAILKESEEKYFDIISFDPRGVNNTTPAAPGIDDPGTLREFKQRLNDFGYAMDDEHSFSKIYDLYRLYGQLISSPENGMLANGEYAAQFMGTAHVARDMIEIVERHGEWRESEARRILGVRCGSDQDCIDRANVLSLPSLDPMLESTVWHGGSEKLQYWGFSYGTVLGQTFASMYPERVGRLVLDGVVNASDYYAGEWKTALTNSEDINVNFTAACAAVGPSVCPMAKWIEPSQHDLTQAPIYAPENKSSKLLSELKAYLTSLKTFPVTSLFAHAQSPTFVSHSDAMHALFQLHYSGWTGYRVASRMLYELSQHNASFFHIMSPPFSCPPCASNTTSPSPPTHDHAAAQLTILCTDASPHLQNTTRDDWRDYVAFLQSLSPTFFGYVSTILLPCTAHSIRPKWRFASPLGASRPRLNNPILFVSQTLDPITPLVSAEGAAGLFEGSGLVEAQGVGHCSFGWPNACAMREVKSYFRTGEVPRERVRCPASVRAFEGEKEAEERMGDMEAGEREMLEALAEAARHWPPGSEVEGYSG